MKIAFSTSGQDLAAELDPRFGRARNFLIYDTETQSFVIIDNEQNLNAAQGAGIQAGQTIVKSGATALVTGHVGPKAYKVLAAAGIEVYLSDKSTVSASLAAYQAGELPLADTADVEGHWA